MINRVSNFHHYLYPPLHNTKFLQSKRVTFDGAFRDVRYFSIVLPVTLVKCSHRHYQFAGQNITNAFAG